MKTTADKTTTTASATPDNCAHQYRETEIGPIGATCVKCGDFARLKGTIPAEKRESMPAAEAALAIHRRQNELDGKLAEKPTAKRPSIAQREQRWQDRALVAEAHADKLAEALVNALNIIASLDEDHYEFRPSFIAGHATLAAYESEVRP